MRAVANLETGISELDGEYNQLVELAAQGEATKHDLELLGLDIYTSGDISKSSPSIMIPSRAS